MTRGVIGSIEGNQNASGELCIEHHEHVCEALRSKLVEQVLEATVVVERDTTPSRQIIIRRMPGRGSFA